MLRELGWRSCLMRNAAAQDLPHLGGPRRQKMPFVVSVVKREFILRSSRSRSRVFSRTDSKRNSYVSSDARWASAGPGSSSDCSLRICWICLTISLVWNPTICPQFDKVDSNSNIAARNVESAASQSTSPLRSVLMTGPTISLFGNKLRTWDRGFMENVYTNER